MHQRQRSASHAMTVNMHVDVIKRSIALDIHPHPTSKMCIDCAHYSRLCLDEIKRISCQIRNWTHSLSSKMSRTWLLVR